jgi:LPXTG-motif cell wall-anchored protein
VHAVSAGTAAVVSGALAGTAAVVSGALAYTGATIMNILVVAGIAFAIGATLMVAGRRKHTV